MPYKRKKRGSTQDAKKVGSKLSISMKKKKTSKTANLRLKPQNGLNFLIDSKCLWKKMKRKGKQKNDSTTNGKGAPPEVLKEAKLFQIDGEPDENKLPKKVHNISKTHIIDCTDDSLFKPKNMYDLRAKNITTEVAGDVEMSQICAELCQNGWTEKMSDLSEDPIVDHTENSHCDQRKECEEDITVRIRKDEEFSIADTKTRKRGRPKKARNFSKAAVTNTFESDQYEQREDVYDVLERIINVIENDSKLSRVCTEPHEGGTPKNPSHLSEDFVINIIEDTQSKQMKELDVDKINTTMENAKLCPASTEPRKRGRPKGALNISKNSITHSYGNKSKQLKRYEKSIQNMPADIAKGKKLSVTPTKRRKRGRPKKALNLSKDPTLDNDGNQSVEMDKHKGSLQNISSDVAKGKESSLTPTKRRKRGRPKKIHKFPKDPIVDGSEDNFHKEYVDNNDTVTEIMEDAELAHSGTKPRKRGRPRKVRPTSDSLEMESAEDHQSEVATNLEDQNEESSTKRKTFMNELTADDPTSDDGKPMSDVQRKLLEYKDYINAPSPKKPEPSNKLIDEWKDELEECNQLKCRQKGCGKLLTSLGGMIYHHRICQTKWVCNICQQGFRVDSSRLLHHIKKHFINASTVKAVNNQDESSTKDISLNVSNVDKSNSDFIQMEETLSMNSSTSMNTYPMPNIEKKLLKFREHIIFPEIKEKAAVAEKLTKKWRKELELREKIKCPEKDCNVSLSTIAGMIYHYETACQRKWTCSICDKGFKTYSVKLLKHMRLHFPEPNVSIPSNSATQASSFQSHVHAFFSRDFHGIWPEAFKPKKSSWKFLNSNEYEDFLPLVRTSIKIAFDNSVSEDDVTWFSLPLFESSLKKADSDYVSFFAGNRVTSSAWCPTKYNVEAAQYICIATSETSLNCRNRDNNNRDVNGLLQLWNIGNLHSSRLVQSPVLSLAIAHTHGPIRAMVWCPQGCWEDPFEAINNASDFMPRLGVIAVACSDSFIRLYSIPHPQALEYVSSNLPICTSDPVLILRPHNGMPFTQRLECTALSWHRSDDSKIIVGGYNNGFICLFDISLHLPMTSQYVYPYSVFHAHLAAVTSVALGPLRNHWLATMSFDKKVKVWNLEDTSWPVRENKQAFGKSLSWSVLWPGVFGSFDGLDTKSSALMEFSSFRRLRRICCDGNSSQWAQSLSEWLNTLVLGDGFGSVTVSSLYKYKHSHFSRCFHVFNTEVIALADKDDVSSSQESETKHQYGLRFIDYNLKDANGIYRRTLEKPDKSQTSCFDGVHLAAIDTVQFNPNFGSHSWIFSVGQSGIVRLMHIPELKQTKHQNVLERSSSEE